LNWFVVLLIETISCFLCLLSSSNRPNRVSCEILKIIPVFPFLLFLASYVSSKKCQGENVRLPARIEKAQAVLKQQWEAGTISHKRGKEKTYGYEQAYRVAWRNILDWVEAQMALIEIEMAKLEEVFLPYMVDRNGRTYFETLEQNHFQLESGKVQEGKIIEV